MRDREKKLLEILDKIGEGQPKRKSRGSAEGSLRDGVEKVEDLLIQEGLLEKVPMAKLTETEREKLMDTCLQMRTDQVETLNVCMSLNAFFVSILSLIVSVSATVLTQAENLNTAAFVFAVLAIVVILGLGTILLCAAVTTRKNAKKADRYRNAYILLRLLQEEGAGETEEEKKL